MNLKIKYILYFFLILQTIYCVMITVLFNMNTKGNINTKKMILFDLRQQDEYNESHIEGAINIKAEDLIEHIDTYNIKKNQTILLYCGIDCGISNDLRNELENKNYSEVYTIQWENSVKTADTDDIEEGYASISMRDFIDIIDELDKKSYMIIDIRKYKDYKKEHIKNAINIPLKKIDKKMKGYCDKDKTIYVYCQTGKNSKRASKLLFNLGYKNVFNIGGIDEYNEIMKER